MYHSEFKIPLCLFLWRIERMVKFSYYVSVVAYDIAWHACLTSYENSELYRCSPKCISVIF